MLNLRLLVNFFTIVFLVLVQSLIFNKISFEQVATPYIYVIFILLYHPNKNRYIFLLLCFLLGWGIDMFDFTGGIHAFASISMAVLTKPLIKLISASKFFEVEEFRFTDFKVSQWIIYTSVLVFIHHFILFLFESFSLSNIEGVLLRTVYSSAFTLVFIYFYLILFRKRERR